MWCIRSGLPTLVPPNFITFIFLLLDFNGLMNQQARGKVNYNQTQELINPKLKKSQL
jgi:hypothetical protein